MPGLFLTSGRSGSSATPGLRELSRGPSRRRSQSSEPQDASRMRRSSGHEPARQRFALITRTHFRSVVLTEHGPVFKRDQLLEVPRQETFVVVKPLVVGVCSSDVKELSGVRPHRKDFGHEIVGTVIHTNMDGPLRAGDRVVYDPHVKLTRNSGFSEFVIASSPAAGLEKAFLKVGESLPVDKLVFLEPMACIVH